MPSDTPDENGLSQDDQEWLEGMDEGIAGESDTDSGADVPEQEGSGTDDGNGETPSEDPVESGDENQGDANEGDENQENEEGDVD